MSLEFLADKYKSCFECNSRDVKCQLLSMVKMEPYYIELLKSLELYSTSKVYLGDCERKASCSILLLLKNFNLMNAVDTSCFNLDPTTLTDPFFQNTIHSLLQHPSHYIKRAEIRLTSDIIKKVLSNWDYLMTFAKIERDEDLFFALVNRRRVTIKDAFSDQIFDLGVNQREIHYFAKKIIMYGLKNTEEFQVVFNELIKDQLHYNIKSFASVIQYYGNCPVLYGALD